MPLLKPLFAAIVAGILGMLVNMFRPTVLINIEIVFGGIFPLLIAYRFGSFWALISGVLTFALTPLYWSHFVGWLCYGLEGAVVGYLIHRRDLRLLNASALYWLCVGGPIAGVYFLFFSYASFPANYIALVKYIGNGLVVALIAQEIANRRLLRGWLHRPEQAHVKPPLHKLLVNRFSFIAVMPVIVISAVSFTIFDRYVSINTREGLERDATEVSSRISREIEAQRAGLSQLVAGWSDKTEPTAEEVAQLIALRREWPGVTRISLVDQMGQVIAVDQSAPPAAGRPGSTTVYALPLPPAAEVSSPIAIMELSTERLGDLAKRDGRNTDRAIMVLDQAHRMLVIPPRLLAVPPENLLNEVFRGAVEMQHRSFTHDRWRPETSRAERFRAAASRIHATGWDVVVEEPLWASQAIVVELFSGTLLAVIIVAIFIHRLSRRTAADITAPLDKLVAYTSTLARGEPAPLPPDLAQAPAEELIRISRDLEATAQQLSKANVELGEAVTAREKSHQAREALLNELEQKVQERTADLNTALQHAETANRTKGEFIAMMNHELRTPLNVILGSIELMNQGRTGPLSDGQRDSLRTMSESGTHLLTLIDEVLDFSQTEAKTLSLRPTAIDPRNVLEFLIRLLQDSAAAKNITLQTTFEHRAKVIYADAKRLKQIVLNLLSNAVKFTPSGGVVTLETAEFPARNVFRIVVRDTGIGIAPQEYTRVFQPFHQCDRTLSRDFEGAGLGLTLVKRLTELHGGTVGLRSAVGEGSEFTVELPLTRVPVISSSRAPHQPFRPKPEAPSSPLQVNCLKSNPTVLIVEDNPTNAELIKANLEYLGAHVRWAENGRDGVDQAIDHRPELILMDVQMPVMDGIAATRALRADERTSHIPIVMVTALSDELTRETCERAGANNFLPKPFTLQSFYEAIRPFLKTSP
ncbi:ATP-binding protein [Synoicihabitans lomoniglobus]|uniref:histidine kinase n=1 Tax=Synoicihabitans lomoniglobus TaxID=2909285 RepID=A0AAF0CRJ6_9BACT|nr:response regulator [Opitutaceae bacterium LMO-M01]WED66745.1 response regulator [Opitutaceae bacterium LMO-M01]